MKKVLLLTLGVVCVFGIRGLIVQNKSQITNDKSQIKNKIQISKPVPTNHSSLTTSHSLFVPYWASSINEDESPYTYYYYFGIRPTKEGRIENEVGYQKISLVDAISEKKKKIVLRMLDASVTESILTRKDIQQILISEIKEVLNKKSFSGIVLDIEVPFTLQADKEKQITSFVQKMCTAIHTDYKTCDVLIYGDFQYRKRPYNLKKISEFTDTILLMAYDFHKAGGEPGPNFPLSRRSVGEGGSYNYGYDFKTMISDATSLVPKNKIEVVFGMYGYDWTLNEQGTPLKSAQALSVREIQALNSNSKLQITNQLQITNSKEKSIQYTDEEGRRHVIWYEDEESARVKTKYLIEQGIGRVSFWAHSYF